MSGWRQIAAALALALGMMGAPPAAADQAAEVYTVGSEPAGMAVDSVTGLVYVANTETPRLEVVDPSTGVVDRIPIPAPARNIVVDPQNRRLYYGEEHVLGEASDVKALDLATGTEVASVGGPMWPTDMALDSANGRLYMTDILANRLWVFDAETLAVIQQVEIDAGTSPTGLALDAENNRAYIARQTDQGGIAVVDTGTNTVIDTFGEPWAFWVAIDASRNRLFVTHHNEENLRVYDTVSHALLATLPMPAGPYGVATDPVNDRVYVPTATGDVAIVSASRMTVLHTVHLPSRAYLVEAVSDTRSAFVSDLAQPGSVTRISGRFLRADPREIVVSDVVAGTPGTARARFTAAGHGAVAVAGLAFTGADADRFTITSDTCSGTSVPEGSSCEVTVSVAPTSGAAAQAVLEVTSDDEDGVRRVPISVTWGASGPAVPPAADPPAALLPEPEAPTVTPVAPRTGLRVTARPKRWAVPTTGRVPLVTGVNSNGTVVVRARCTVGGADTTARRRCGLRVKRPALPDPVTALVSPKVRVSAAPQCSAVRIRVTIRAKVAGAEPARWRRVWRADPTPRVPCGVPVG